MRSFFQGVALGVAIVLPGLSGGTAAVVMGIYRQLIEDFSSFRWRPHLLLAGGAGLGVLGGARATGWLLERTPGLLSAFLLGVVLASAWLVFRRQGRPNAAGLLAWAAGVAVAVAVAREPLAAGTPSGAAAQPGFVFLGGAVASAAMMLPGMSGGTILIMMGLYDDMLAALNGFNLPVLAVFLGGAVLGVFGVARLVAGMLARHPVVTGFFLAGMILGSARAVLPGGVDVPEVLAFAAGAGLVLLGGEG